ncbi:MAG TPA: carboxypeptidase-like regulatory domain-containing protein, partial [Gemmatimonadaceae bacterium]
MTTIGTPHLRALALGCALLIASDPAPLHAVQPAGQPVRVDPDDIGGVVTGPNGPEAGVWVIAETTDLPTKFVRIVVTDERGRYLLPDLPKAGYRVWVRGYGLVDSPQVQAAPGKVLNLTAAAAPNARAAAEYYPAGYWFSLLRVPDKSEFPGTGPEGNGISASVRSQAAWLRNLKSGNCWACHQLGNKATREIPQALGPFASSMAAWERRVQSGQAGAGMSGSLDQFGRRRVLEMFADWTDRIAAGEVP